MTGMSLPHSHAIWEPAPLSQSLKREANSDPNRTAVRWAVTLIVSGFLFAYVSVSIACIWLFTTLALEVGSEGLRRRVARGQPRLDKWYIASVFGITLMWVIHAALLWAQDEEIARIAALIDLFTVTLYAAIGGHKDKRIMAAMMAFPLCVLAAFLIHASWVEAPFFVAIVATLATLGACLTMAANGWAMHISDRKLVEAVTALERERSSLESRVAERTRELRVAHQEVKSASQAKSIFLNTMSHELRTPLNAILGYAEILLEDVETGAADAADIRRIIASGQRLLKMVNNVLDLASLEAGRASVYLQNVDLEEIIRSAFKATKYGMAENESGLQLQATADIRLAMLDAKLFGQILCHLLENALKYAPNKNILVRAATDGENQIVVDVVDEGPGMSADEIARIFRPFEQASQGNTRASEGAGLGLAITNRLVNLLGGQIEAISCVGKGTTMRVRLPLLARHEIDGGLAPKPISEPGD